MRFYASREVLRLHSLLLCLAHLNSIDWTRQAIRAAIKKFIHWCAVFPGLTSPFTDVPCFLEWHLHSLMSYVPWNDISIHWCAVFPGMTSPFTDVLCSLEWHLHSLMRRIPWNDISIHWCALFHGMTSPFIDAPCSLEWHLHSLMCCVTRTDIAIHWYAVFLDWHRHSLMCHVGCCTHRCCGVGVRSMNILLTQSCALPDVMSSISRSLM